MSLRTEPQAKRGNLQLVGDVRYAMGERGKVTPPKLSGWTQELDFSSFNVKREITVPVFRFIT